eukprot:5461523-Pyramimonas_sp.AAC.1
MEEDFRWESTVLRECSPPLRSCAIPRPRTVRIRSLSRPWGNAKYNRYGGAGSNRRCWMRKQVYDATLQKLNCVA